MFEKKIHYYFDLSKLEIIDDDLGISILFHHNFSSMASDHETIVDAEGNILLSCQLQNKRRHGECKTYYPNHKLKSKCYYFEGRLHGPSYYYTEEGVCVSLYWFVAGQRQGKAYLYYQTSELLGKEGFLDDLYHGEQLYYYRGGQIKSELYYDKGSLQGKIRLFYPNGQIKRATEYEAHLRHGEDRIFSLEGILVERERFLEGDAV
jgi:antitoxin component YwqK of YwqJK toxin-antitoxin module